MNKTRRNLRLLCVGVAAACAWVMSAAGMADSGGGDALVTPAQSTNPTAAEQPTGVTPLPEAPSVAKATAIPQKSTQTSRGTKWNGYVEARASANDPPAPASNPANDTLSFTVDSASPQRHRCPPHHNTPPK